MKTYKNFSEYKTSLLTALDKVQASELDDFISLLLKTRDNSKNIFIAGNGGSAAIASHFVVDLLKIPEVNKKSFSVINSISYNFFPIHKYL
jgi:D-sedoheptulose 7-phosphate isomerase